MNLEYFEIFEKYVNFVFSLWTRSLKTNINLWWVSMWHEDYQFIADPHSPSDTLFSWVQKGWAEGVSTQFEIWNWPSAMFASTVKLPYTLLNSDVTRRDHMSVVMDAGSRIVNFIVNFNRDGTVFAQLWNIQYWCACALVHVNQRGMTMERVTFGL